MVSSTINDRIFYFVQRWYPKRYYTPDQSGPEMWMLHIPQSLTIRYCLVPYSKYSLQSV